MKASNIYPLDCAAIMLPYAIHKKITPAVFRMTAGLNTDISINILRQAVIDLAPRFPVIYTRLNKGFIWDKLITAKDLDVVIDEKDYPIPCRPFDYWASERPLFRIIYGSGEISLEFCHMTFDGFVAIVYLNSLIARCLEIKGYIIEKNHIVRKLEDITLEDSKLEGELEDYYRTCYQKPKGKFKRDEGPTYQYPTQKGADFSPVTIFDLPLNKVKKLLKEKYKGYTINQYLGAVFSAAFIEFYKKDKRKNKKPLKIAFTGNLRQFWKVDTLRNFSGAVRLNVAPDGSGYNFLDLLSFVRREMNEKMTKESQQEITINQNVRYLYWPIIKVIPGFVKKFVAGLSLSLANKFMWPHTATFSNLGFVDIPPSLAPYIHRFFVFTGDVPTNRPLCTAMGVNNILSVAFSGPATDTYIQDFCLDFFKKDGLPVRQELRYSDKPYFEPLVV